MIRTNSLLAAGAAVLLLAACDDAPRTTQVGGQPAVAAQAAAAGETDRSGETDLSGVADRLQERIGDAAEATRQAAEDAGGAIRDEIGSLDTRAIAKGIRAVGWGFEEAGRILGEAAERAAANLEARAAPEVRETAQAAPEMPAQQ